MRTTNSLIPLALAMATSACGGGSGSGSDAGQGGNCEQCWPACYRAMFDDCLPSSTAVVQDASESANDVLRTNYCFDNGVKASFAKDFATPLLPEKTTIYKPDGSICVTEDKPAAGDSTVTYSDKDGKQLLVYVGTLTSESFTGTITCDGHVHHVDHLSQACLNCYTTVAFPGDSPQPASYSQGTCAIP